MTLPPDRYPDQPNPSEQPPGATPPGLEWLPSAPPAGQDNPFASSGFSPAPPPAAPKAITRKTLIIGILIIALVSAGSGLTAYFLTKDDGQLTARLASSAPTTSTPSAPASIPTPTPTPSAGTPSAKPGTGSSTRPATVVEQALITGYFEAVRTHDLSSAKNTICSRVVSGFERVETQPGGDFSNNTSLASYRILNAHPTTNDVKIDVEVKSLIDGALETTKFTLSVEPENGILKICNKREA